MASQFLSCVIQPPCREGRENTDSGTDLYLGLWWPVLGSSACFSVLSTTVRDILKEYLNVYVLSQGRGKCLHSGKS